MRDRDIKTMQQNGSSRLSLYPTIREIGQGSFGKVYLCLDQRESKSNDASKAKHVVMKCVDFRGLDAKQRSDAIKEVGFLAKLGHKHITGYVDHFMTRKEEQQYVAHNKRRGHAMNHHLRSQNQSDNNILYIVQEYADGGDLSSAIKKQKNMYFPERTVIKWFCQMLMALEHMHSHKIMHRDIKAENIFLTRAGDVKIGDFGISTRMAHTMAMAKTRIGTPYYLSPEICMDQPYNAKSDIWSLGVVLHEMLLLKHPFDADSIEKLLERICKSRPAPIPRKFNPELQRITDWLLQKKERNRPSAKELLKDPWIAEQCRLLDPSFGQPQPHKENVQSIVASLPDDTVKKKPVVPLSGRRAHGITPPKVSGIARVDPHKNYNSPPEKKVILHGRRKSVSEEREVQNNPVTQSQPNSGRGNYPPQYGRRGSYPGKQQQSVQMPAQVPTYNPRAAAQQRRTNNVYHGGQQQQSQQQQQQRDRSMSPYERMLARRREATQNRVNELAAAAQKAMANDQPSAYGQNRNNTRARKNESNIFFTGGQVEQPVKRNQWNPHMHGEVRQTGRRQQQQQQPERNIWSNQSANQRAPQQTGYSRVRYRGLY